MFIGDFICQKRRKKLFRIEKIGIGVGRVFRPLAIPASGTYLQTTDVAVNTRRSLVEHTVNDVSFQASYKNPCTSATLALSITSVGKTKKTCIIC